MNLPRTTYALVLFGTCVWCAMILLAPLLAASSSPAAEFIYRFFRPICHQNPERSFFLFAEKLGVCVRCSSVYFAFLLGVVLFPFARGLDSMRIPSRRVLLLTLVPIVLEVATEWVGLYRSTALTRALTGGVFGYVVSFVILPTAIEAVQQIVQRRSATVLTTINQQEKGNPHA